MKPGQDPDLGEWFDQVRWDENGLAPVVTQDAASGRVLTLAWMNREALAETARSGAAVYWSRSRRRLWRKGEESGHVQKVLEVRLDCDADAILLRVEQVGGIACHTGRESCFFRKLDNGRWVATDPVLKDPSLIYGKR
ncbi:MAG: phosphoribosyl-AMP cyclohydrolase [Betaproteobacteria bacterium]|nr:phosphoribosyl-AMP cyclohydrolase [Betaproteobacteria bacterium]